MGRISAASLIVFLVVFTISCSSDSSPTLQLRTGPIGEDAFRFQVRKIASLQPSQFEITCGQIDNGSVDATLTADFLEAFQRTNPFVTVVRPLAYHSADARRAVEIIAEECESASVRIAACGGTVRSNERPSAVGAQRVDMGTIERHTDVSELIVIGTVVERNLLAERVASHGQGNLFPEEPLHDGQEGLEQIAPAIIRCIGQYTVEVSQVLKDVHSDPLPSQIDIRVEEREAYPSEGYVIEVATPFALGERITWFLHKTGVSGRYVIFGPQQVLSETVDIDGDYSHEGQQLSVEEFVGRVSAQAARVPEALWPLDVLKTPIP